MKIQARLDDETASRLSALALPGETRSDLLRRVLVDALDLHGTLARLSWVTVSAGGEMVLSGTADDLRALLAYLQNPETIL